MPFKTREEAELWVRKNQDSRRNSTDEQKKYNLGRIYELEKEVKGGYDNVEAGKKSKGQNVLSISDSTKVTNPTRKRVAEEAGVGERAVRNAANYKTALDALDERGVINKQEVLSGRIKIPAKRVIQAAKSKTPEESKAVLTKPKSQEKEAPAEADTELPIEAEKSKCRPGGRDASERRGEIMCRVSAHRDRYGAHPRQIPGLF